MALILKSRWIRNEKGIVAVCGTAVISLRVHVISPTLHCSDLSVVCGLLRLDPCRCSAAGGLRKRQRGRNQRRAVRSVASEALTFSGSDLQIYEPNCCILPAYYSRGRHSSMYGGFVQIHNVYSLNQGRRNEFNIGGDTYRKPDISINGSKRNMA